MSDNIIERINKALERMRIEGDHLDEYGQPCFYYERLKAKRDAIIDGQSYNTYSIAPYLISYVGSHIPDVNKGMNNKTLKGRGDKEKAIIQAITGY
jgi:hypothetical protein